MSQRTKTQRKEVQNGRGKLSAVIKANLNQFFAYKLSQQADDISKQITKHESCYLLLF